VIAEAVCRMNTTSGTCAWFMPSQTRLLCDFIVDGDSTLSLDGDWQGGSGCVLIVDRFGVMVARVRPTGTFESLR
jgi:hypothetical protein